MKVAGGDRLGKTIIFAKNQAHADFIVERFDANYPQLQGCLRARHHHRRELRAEPDRRLLESGQGAAHRRLGRHARHRHRRPGGRQSRLLQAGALQDEVLADGGARHAAVPGPVRAGDDKKIFYVFDYCRNLEFFSQNPEMADGASGEALGKKLFVNRVELIAAIDAIQARQRDSEDESQVGLRDSLATHLRNEVAAMNLENFLVDVKGVLSSASRRETPGKYCRLKIRLT